VSVDLPSTTYAQEGRRHSNGSYSSVEGFEEFEKEERHHGSAGKEAAEHGKAPKSRTADNANFRTRPVRVATLSSLHEEIDGDNGVHVQVDTNLLHATVCCPSRSLAAPIKCVHVPSCDVQFSPALEVLLANLILTHIFYWNSDKDKKPRAPSPYNNFIK
jgi:hypothetical protein